MRVIVNGRETELPGGVTLAEVVRPLTAAPEGVAAAVDGVVVPRRLWPDHLMTDGARVEVVVAVQGG